MTKTNLQIRTLLRETVTFRVPESIPENAFSHLSAILLPKITTGGGGKPVAENYYRWR
jgi:hypothetical protein